MGAKHITSKAEFDTTINADQLTVVDFTAAWCGPCKIIAPYVDQLAGEYEFVQFIKVDVDEQEEIAATYSVSAMPTFMFFRKGAKLHEFRGASKEQLLASVQKFSV